MRFGRNKTGAAGHIKRNTQGTSNEISFSVLDSMKGQDVEEEEESPLGRISLFTLGPKRPSSTPSKEPRLPGSLSRGAHSMPKRSTWKSNEGEVEARRARRKRSRRFIGAFILVLCLIGAGFGVTIGIGRYQQMQERAQNLSAQIEDVKQQVEVAEPFMQLVETTAATPLPDIDRTTLDQQLSEWEQRQNSIATKMRATKTSIENLEAQLSGAELERANDALGVINATIKAMDAGRAALTEMSAASASYAQAESFLTEAMEGDAIARDAIARELTDDASAEQAIELSNAAIASFAAARTAVESVIAEATEMIQRSDAFESSAAELLQPFIDYANLRITAQEFAIEADRGFLNVSSQQIADANASYNATEEEAAALIADKRDQYPTDIVEKAYEAAMPQSDSMSSWQSERSRAQQLLESL